jgi:prepilin-type N-terminal cleavage/methylation domain-containing protein
MIVINTNSNVLPLSERKELFMTIPSFEDFIYIKNIRISIGEVVTMNQQKGFTLIEVLGSVVILAIAVVSVTYFFQQTTLFSRNTDQVDQSVLATRTVMEEIKHNLNKTAPTSTVYGQSINLQLLRDSTAPYSLNLPIYFPSNDDRQFELVISSREIISPEFNIVGDEYDMSDYFKLIHIICTNLSNLRTFELEAYIEYN